MQTITNGGVPTAQIDQLDRAAEQMGPEMQELLTSLSRCLREGNEIVAFDPESMMTPNQVAARLGMSRSHLYKLLDSGEIPFNRVGRDRRIRLADVAAFEHQRQSDRRELAERFANQQRTREATIEEMADLI